MSLNSVNQAKSEDLSTLYKFYSRSFLQTHKTILTLNSDLINELKIDISHAIQIYDRITTTVMKRLQSEDVTSPTFDNLMKMIDTEKAEDYNQFMLIKRDGCMVRNMVSLSDEEFIHHWLDCYMKWIPKELKVILDIIDRSEFDKNSYINFYIKRYCTILALSKANANFVRFYDYCRFYFLKNIGVTKGLIPQFYDSKSGKLFFSYSYGSYKKREQILEDIIKENTNDDSFTDVCNVPVFIFSPTLGSIYKSKSARPEMVKGFRYEVLDTLDFETPNVIRDMLHAIMNRTNSTQSYKSMKTKVISDLRFIEDCCLKSEDGLTMRVPTANNIWMEVKAEEVRQLSTYDIKWDTIFDKYDDSVIKPMVQSKY